jgi:hypothetical protein
MCVDIVSNTVCVACRTTSPYCHYALQDGEFSFDLGKWLPSDVQGDPIDGTENLGAALPNDPQQSPQVSVCNAGLNPCHERVIQNFSYFMVMVSYMYAFYLREYVSEEFSFKKGLNCARKLSFQGSRNRWRKSIEYARLSSDADAVCQRLNLHVVLYLQSLIRMWRRGYVVNA